MATKIGTTQQVSSIHSLFFFLVLITHTPAIILKYLHFPFLITCSDALSLSFSRTSTHVHLFPHPPRRQCHGRPLEEILPSVGMRTGSGKEIHI